MKKYKFQFTFLNIKTNTYDFSECTDNFVWKKIT